MGLQNVTEIKRQITALEQEISENQVQMASEVNGIKRNHLRQIIELDQARLKRLKRFLIIMEGP